MSTHPLRIDSTLFNLARTDGEIMDRTPTAQVEFWAKLGRAADAVFRPATVRTLKTAFKVQNLSELLAEADTPAGRARFTAEVNRHAVPLYSADPTDPGIIIEKLPNGVQRRGRFVNRRFMPLAGASQKVP
jgi:hypothetical protein